jgi:alcohol dehydrogenase class IV
MAAQALHLGWHNPVRITWGCGALRDLQLNQAAVVLADRAALSLGDADFLREILGTHCAGWAWYEGGLATVGMARQLCKALWPSMQVKPGTIVIAIGGGSTLDLAKAVRYRMADTALCERTWRNNHLPEVYERHPLWLLPTTAGTGSEVTRWATLWDTAIQPSVKLSWSPEDGFAERAIVDPNLTISCPLPQSRDCGLDTLAHALESLWNKKSNPMTAALALEAARTVITQLPVLLQGQDIKTPRIALARASVLAGLAMSQTQTALAHALSYDLTLRENMAHGHACAVWLPMVWELAQEASTDCATLLHRVFDETNIPGAHQLMQWLTALGVSTRDLRTTTSGRERLSMELGSARGRNFIGSPAEAG